MLAVCICYYSSWCSTFYKRIFLWPDFSYYWPVGTKDRWIIHCRNTLCITINTFSESEPRNQRQCVRKLLFNWLWKRKTMNNVLHKHLFMLLLIIHFCFEFQQINPIIVCLNGVKCNGHTSPWFKNSFKWQSGFWLKIYKWLNPFKWDLK